MPSWITHFVTANKIQEDAKNEFIFANIMPDILEGHNIKNVSKIVKNYQTHYPTTKIINDIVIPLPNIDYLKKQKIIMPVYSDQIKKYAQDLKEFEFTKGDIENTIVFIEKMIHRKGEKKKGEYSIFTEKELITNLDNSIAFIKEKLEE